MALLLSGFFDHELFGLGGEQGQLTLLPIQPQAPAREIFEFLTEIQESRNGNELPIQLRSVPRRTVIYSIPESPQLKQLGFNTEYGSYTLRWAVPLWFEADYVGIIPAGQMFITAISTLYDYREDSLALVWESPTKWKVVEIESVDEGVINLYEETEAFQRAFVMPLRAGKVVNTVSRKSNGYDVVTDITFEIIDNVNINLTDTSYNEFEGQDVYYPGSGYLEGPLLDGDRLSYDISSQVDRQDYELGIVSTKAPWTWNRVTRALSVLCEFPEEIRNFKNFLFRRAGRYRKFWEPSFDHDLRLLSTGDVESSLIVAREDGLLDFQRYAIAVEVYTPPYSEESSPGVFDTYPASSYWQAIRIDSIFPISDTEVQIDLFSGINVPAIHIRRICWLGLKRLDSDRIEMDYIGFGNMKTSVPIIEVQSDPL